MANRKGLTCLMKPRMCLEHKKQLQGMVPALSYINVLPYVLAHEPTCTYK